MSLKARAVALAVAAAFASEASLASDRCARRQEVNTLKVAAFQQELMVAALTCHAIGDYNRFVLSYRPELQRSDREMLAVFLRHDGADGDAHYNAFKTRLANLAVLQNNDSGGAFCKQASESFAAAFDNRVPLAEFVEGRPLSVDLPFEDCSERAEASQPALRVAAHHRVFESGTRLNSFSQSDSRSDGEGGDGDPYGPAYRAGAGYDCE